jgi:acylphosphatase
VIDESFAKHLRTLTTVPVEKGFVSDDKEPPWVYFQRALSNTETDLKGEVSTLTDTTFDVEVVGEDDDAVQTLAAALKAALNGYRGTMQGAVVLGAFVADHTDDYRPKSVDSDDGYFLAAFQVEMTHKG